jgi:hypothetical protein
MHDLCDWKNGSSTFSCRRRLRFALCLVASELSTRSLQSSSIIIASLFNDVMILLKPQGIDMTPGLRATLYLTIYIFSFRFAAIVPPVFHFAESKDLLTIQLLYKINIKYCVYLVEILLHFKVSS